MQKQELIAEISNSLTRKIPTLQGFWLYGSFARNEETKDSDIDIAFLAEQSPSLEKKMDLITNISMLARRDVDLVDLRTAPTVLRKEIIAYGQRIYCKDSFFCETFENIVFSDYARLNEERANILSDIQTRGSVHG